MFKAASLSVLWRAALLVELFSIAKAEVDPIIIKGAHFFYKTNGSAFFVGVSSNIYMGSTNQLRSVD